MIPFGRELLKISRLDADNISKNELVTERIVKELSWISKFAFDDDYQRYKSAKLDPIKGEIYSTYANMPLLSDIIEYRFPVLHTLSKQFADGQLLYAAQIKIAFEKDKDEILNTIFNEKIELQIIDILLGEGDRHNQGKSTSIVILSSGKKIVYKPRGSNTEQAFHQIIDSLNSSKLGLEFRYAEVLNRKTYSWIEYIEYRPLASSCASTSYYLRCGGLLALMFAIRATDLHFENIIASGEFPYLIDLECILENSLENFSVRTTGLLPELINFCGEHEDDSLVDISGFGGEGGSKLSSKNWSWVDSFTDNQRLERRQAILPKSRNIPYIDEHFFTAQDHLEQIIEGFTAVFNWVSENKSILCQDGGLLSDFASNIEVRILFRNTQEYRDIMENSLVPSALSGAQDRSRNIRNYLKLYPVHLLLRGGEDTDSIHSSEIESLEQFDIPLFFANSAELSIYYSNQIIIKKYYEESPFNRLLRWVNRFDGELCTEQITMIRRCFEERYQPRKSSVVKAV